MNKKYTLQALLLLGSLLFAPSAMAGQAILNPSADTFMNSLQVSNNNGGSTAIYLGTNGGLANLRGLMRFTMPGNLPYSTTLQGRVTVSAASLATRNMRINQDVPVVPYAPNGAPVAASVALRPQSTAWVEGTGAAWNVADLTEPTTIGILCTTIGSAGAVWGFPNCTGGTWVGGSVTSADASATTPNSVSGLTTWTGLAARVQNWIDTPANNQGWLLTSATEGAAASSVQKLSSRTGPNPPVLTIDYTCKAGFRALGTGNNFCTSCTTAAKNLCQDTLGTNACNDSGLTTATYTCTCGTGFSGNGTTACTDINACSGNPCDTNNTNATCADQAAPALSYVCSCAAGWTAPPSGGTCTQACNCGPGSTCTSIATGGWNCNSCPAGMAQGAGSTPVCTDIDGCASAGNNCLQNIAGSGNSCQDVDPPGVGYTCNCGAGYDGTGTGTCAAHDDCVGNPCNDSGDSTGACTDLPPPSPNHTCTCNTAGGYISNGVTCVQACSMSSNPCLVGGSSCAATGATTWTCSCPAGYRTTGGTQPTCVNYNACSGSGATGNTNCRVSSGNNCNDSAPPSESYTCTCATGYSGTGTTACNDTNGCAGQPCDAGGDTGPNMACADVAAPGVGFTCTCDVGYDFDGTTCTSQCNGSNNPCGGGGACTPVAAGGWTCACSSGYQTSGGAATLPTCVNIDSCDATALNNCTFASGNGCVDDAPPGTSYTCNCGNAAYVVGTGGNGRAACVNRNECQTDHCVENGDASAACTDHPAPDVGYDCTCSSTLWTTAVVGAFLTCVDTDECATAINPCEHGACTNVPDGGGYTCACDPGYIATGGLTPVCFHPGSCDANADISCVAKAPGNVCVDTPPPKIGYTCDCGNPAYTPSIDNRSCVDQNDCATNHCIDEGDPRADCVDRHPPKAGYDCNCSVGFESDGKTCLDVNECVGGANPCGKGTCTNTKGSYQCTCGTGFELKKNSQLPTCVASNGGGNFLSYTIEPGCAAAGRDLPSDLASLVFASLALLAIARRRTAAPVRR